MPPRQVQKFGFPAGGVSENFSFESQPPGTTVSAQNVRAYDAKSGRLRGGQRPGLKKFVADQFELTNTAGTNPKAFQSLVQLTGTDLAKSAGDKSVAIPKNSGTSSTVASIKDFPGVSGTKTTSHTSTLHDAVGTAGTFDGQHQLAVYSKDSDLYAVTVDTQAFETNKYWVYIHKITHYDGNQNIAPVKLGYLGSAPGDDQYIVGLGHYKSSLYILVNGTINGDDDADLITTGTKANCVLQIKDDLTAIEDTSPSFAHGNASDALTNNLLAVGRDRLYATAGSATAIVVKCWKLGIQGISDAPTDVSVTPTGGASSSNARYDLTMDNKGGAYLCYKFDDEYYISKISRSFELDTDFGSSGHKLATNTLNSISYCHRTDRLGVAGATDGSGTGLFSGVRLEVCLLNPQTGAVLAPTTGGSKNRLVSGINDWSCIRAKGDGEFYLSRISTATVTVAATTNVYPEYLASDNDWESVGGDDGNTSNKTYTVGTTHEAAANRSGSDRGLAVYNVFDLEFGEKSTVRRSYLVGVGEGTIRVMEMNDDTANRKWADVARTGSGPDLEHSVPVIFGIPFYGTVGSSAAAKTVDQTEEGIHARKPSETPIYGAFFVDGFNKKYYDFYDNKVKGWTSNENLETRSSFPKDSGDYFPNLIENWRGRIVMSGCPNEPHNWYMSATGTADDFEYFPAIVTEYTAAAGHVSDAGEMPDIVRGLVPITDDVLLFLGDKSIWQLSGDPMSGGRFDLITNKVGGAWGRAWCVDPTGSVYFFGSSGGVYRMQPRSMPERITGGVIDKRLRDVDLSTTIVRMEWNDKEQGIHLFLTKNDTTSTEECYFFDARSGSWWPDKFAHVAHNTSNIMVYDGDASGDREVLIGGRDGNIYQFDPATSQDTTHAGNQAISSHVYLGPVGNGQKIVVDELEAKIALDSGQVNWALHAGSSAEAALPGDIVGDDTSKTTRGQVGTGSWTVSTVDSEKVGKNVERMRAVGDAFYMKLYGTGTARWSFESIGVQYHPVGRQSSRSL